MVRASGSTAHCESVSNLLIANGPDFAGCFRMIVEMKGRIGSSFRHSQVRILAPQPARRARPGPLRAAALAGRLALCGFPPSVSC
jgi:hypothetical protein